MPLEIRELVIRARIGDQQGNSSESDTSRRAGDDDQDTSIIVQMCVEQVMKRLQEKCER